MKSEASFSSNLLYFLRVDAKSLFLRAVRFASLDVEVFRDGKIYAARNEASSVSKCLDVEARAYLSRLIDPAHDDAFNRTMFLSTRIRLFLAD